LTSGPIGPIKEWDSCIKPEELDSVKEILERIDIALERLETLKEGL
jgi:hypothetical protein